MNQDNASQTLFNLLVTKNFEPQALDAQGKPANPADAVMFSFDYKGQSGKDYGTVTLLLDDNLNVFCGDNTGKAMEDGEDRKEWFDDFLYQLKNWAVRNAPEGSLNIQNLNKLKYSMQGQAAIKEGLFEGWQGKKDVSWNAAPTEARLMIKHKKVIGEGEARFRYIESLFIETAEGERFKLPFESLSAGKAMLEHVRQGGKPYDIRGNHIGTIVQEMKLLNRFQRASQGKIFEGETAHLVEEAKAYYETLKHNLKSLTTRNGYKKYFETWNAAAITDEDVIIEDLRHLFVEQNIDSRVEQALPLLAKLKQEHAMKEINVFEGWMNLLSEGTWALPDTKEKQTALITLLSQELPVGPDATNATEQLYDILGDDELFDKLGKLAQQDANADARTVILDRLEQMKNDPSIAQVIGKLKIETNPAEQNADQSEQDLNEFALNVDAEFLDKKQKVNESGMSEVDILLQEIARGNVDIYDVFAAPKSNIEKFVSKQIHEKAEEVAREQHLHLDDDIEDILARVQRELEVEYGTDDNMDIEMDEDRLKVSPHDAGSFAALKGKSYDSNPHPKGTPEHLLWSKGHNAMRAHSANLEETISGENWDEGRQDYVAERRELDRMSNLAGIKKESLLAPAVGAIGGAVVGGELASNIGSKFGSEVGGSIGQAAGQEQAGKLGAIVGGMKGSSAGAAAGGAAAKKFGQVAGGIAGLAGGAAIDQAKNSNDDEETNEDSNKKSGSSVLPALAAGAAGAGLGYMAGKAMGGSSTPKPASTSAPSTTGSDNYGSWEAPGQPSPPTAVGSGLGIDPPVAGSAADAAVSSILEKDGEETDEGWKGQLAGGVLGTIGGGIAGAALGGPVGATIGSAAGGFGGQMIGDKLGGSAETDEGVSGALAGGALGGAATRSVKGAMAGAKLGSAIQDRYAKSKSDSVKEGTALQGQYGHSGKLEAVKGLDQDMMDRIKFLAGITK